MLRLTLLRHAKSSWAEPGLGDEQRPLNARGLAAAPALGAFIAREGIVPDLVLCSTSVRTRQTAELALGRLDPAPGIAFEREIYLAAASQLLARVRRLPTKVRHAMIIGHNPGLQKLAHDLVGDGPANDINAIGEKLPTAGLVEIGFEVDSWEGVGNGTGRLLRFTTPKRLEAMTSGRA